MGGTAFDSRIHWESLTKILNCNTELPINLWFIGCVHTKVYSNGWDLFYMKVNEEWHPKSRNKIMGKIPHTTFNSWTNFSACKSKCQTVFQLITTVTGMQIKSVWFVVFIVSVWSAEVLELERSTVCWQRQLLQLVLMETKRECCKPAFHYQHKMWLRQQFLSKIVVLALLLNLTVRVRQQEVKRKMCDERPTLDLNSKRWVATRPKVAYLIFVSIFAPFLLLLMNYSDSRVWAQVWTAEWPHYLLFNPGPIFTLLPVQEPTWSSP